MLERQANHISPANNFISIGLIMSYHAELLSIDYTVITWAPARAPAAGHLFEAQQHFHTLANIEFTVIETATSPATSPTVQVACQSSKNIH